MLVVPNSECLTGGRSITACAVTVVIQLEEALRSNRS